MKRQPLDTYDDMPRDMKRYISNYGWHFSKRAYEYAVTFMKSKEGKATPLTKEHVAKMLDKHGIELENDVMYDSVYAATMCMCDFLGSSITDEKHMALFIKDTIDDVDAADGTLFRRWVATMVGNGTPIDWIEVL